jgi:lipopolysaccharide/colanic/teichoic acid biosynthesis glycosyltransferase
LSDFEPSGVAGPMGAKANGSAAATSARASVVGGVALRMVQPLIVAISVGVVASFRDPVGVRALVAAAASAVAFGVVDAAPPYRRGLSSMLPSPLPLAFWLLLALGLAASSDFSNDAVGLPTARACIAVGVAWGVLWCFRRGITALGCAARERILVVGSGDVAKRVAEALEAQRGSVVVGFVHDDVCDEPGDAAAVVGHTWELELLISRHRISNVIFAYSSQPDHAMVQAVRRCRSLGVQIGIVARMFQELDRRAVLRRVDSIPILTIEPTLADSHTPVLSRAVDIVAALILGVVTLPITVVVAIAIVIDSRGGVLYRATRVGYRGGTFSMLKFRKMRSDASGPRITVAGDERFSRVGRFLAASKLDELPQLWNVLRGEMTLVGPRPEDPHYVALYPGEYEKILSVRPGMTGLAQIQYRDEASLLLGEDYEELYSSRLLPAKITIDRYYAERRSLRLDLQIMFWTIVAVLRGACVEHHPLTDAIHFRRGEITTFDIRHAAWETAGGDGTVPGTPSQAYAGNR